MPRTAYQMPVRTDLAARVGPRLWRKTILRPGHISKGGIDLDVDRPYLQSLVRSFQAGAKDQVQLVFANSGNQHDESPEQYRGEVIDLQLTDDDRLDAIVATTARGDKALSENRRLGVSPSLETNFSRADGRAGEAVLLHICGTLDPEVSKLGEWARADLSATYDQVIDLTSAEITTSATHAAAGSGGKPSQPEGGAPVPTLTDEDRQLLSGVRDLLPGLTSLVTRFNENGDTDEGADDQSGDQGTAGKGKRGRGKTSRKPTADAQDDTDSADDTDDTGDGDGGEGGEDEFDGDAGFTEAELAAMAAGTGDADSDRLAASADERVTQLQLSHQKLSAERDQDKIELARLRRKDDVREYEKLRGELAQQHRVPPYITDLCRAVLEGEGRLQLSAGKNVNVRDMVVKALSELAQVGPLDLSAAQGTAHDISGAKAEDDQMNTVIEMAKARRFGM